MCRMGFLIQLQSVAKVAFLRKGRAASVPKCLVAEVVDISAETVYRAPVVAIVRYGMT
jgi:hypothetical protein